MAFRTNANLDANARQGLIFSDSVTNALRVQTGLNLTSANAAHVAIVDGTGSQITSFGGGTQYAEGTTAATATGTLAMGKSGTTLKATQTDGSGNLRIDLSQTSANTTAIKVDASATTQPVSGTVTANQGGTWDIRNVSGTVALPTGASTAAKQPALGTAGTASADVITVQGIASMTAVKVDGSAVTQPVSGTVTANAGTNLNTSALALESGGNLATISGAIIAQEATTSGVKGVTAFGAVTTAKPTYTTSKSDALSLDVNGLLRVSLADTPANTNKLLVTPDSVALPANQSVNVNQINSVTPLMGNGVTGTGSQRVTIASDNTAFSVNAIESGTWNVGSSTATGSAVPANAFYAGAIAKTALPTAATDGNLTGAMVDKFGRLVVLPNAMRDLVNPITQLTLTSTTTETTLIAAVASTFNDIVSLAVVNTSATATQVDFRDSTGGTIRLSLYVPAGDTRGIVLTTPMPQNTVNNNWTAKCGTSVASVIITGSYVANK